MSGPGRVQHQKIIMAKERQRKALEYRKAGMTYADIARQLGYSSPATASRAVKSALAFLVSEPAQELVMIELARLNHMLLTLWPKVSAGDERAIETSLRIMERLDRLTGVDEYTAPTPAHVTNNNVLVIEGDSESEYIARLRKMVARTDPSVEVMPELEPATEDPQVEIIEASVEIEEAEIIE